MKLVCANESQKINSMPDSAMVSRDTTKTQVYAKINTKEYTASPDNQKNPHIKEMPKQGVNLK